MAELWKQLDSDPLRARQQLERVFPDLIRQFGQASAALAADWFESVMDREAAVAAEAVDEQANAAMRWGMAEAFKTQDVGASLPAVQGVVDRLVKQQGRDTILASANRHGIRFARVPHGKTCAWCSMLASRGFVYESRATAGGGGSHGSKLDRFHAQCDCQIVPDDGVVPEGYDPDALYVDYKKVHQKGMTDAEVVARMREADPDKYTDGKQIQPQAANDREKPDGD